MVNNVRIFWERSPQFPTTPLATTAPIAAQQNTDADGLSDPVLQVPGANGAGTAASVAPVGAPNQAAPPSSLVASPSSLVASPPSSSAIQTSALASSSSGTKESAKPQGMGGHNQTLSAGGKPAQGSSFKLVYLTPLFILIGLFLIFSVGGRVWGKVWRARSSEMRRRKRHARRIEKEAREEELRRIQEGWGYQSRPLRKYNTNKTKEFPDADSDDSDDEKSPGAFHVLTNRLLGEKGKAVPPTTRGRTGKYEAKVHSNSWFLVQLRRAFLGDDREHELVRYTTAPSMRHTPSRDRLRQMRGSHQIPDEEVGEGFAPSGDAAKSNKSTLRATLRGTWDRIKKHIPWNVGFGYPGRAPGIEQRLEIVRAASDPQSQWAESLAMQYSSGGLLLPPQIGDGGKPYMPGEGPKYDLTPVGFTRYPSSIGSRLRTRSKGSYKPVLDDGESSINEPSRLGTSGSRRSLSNLRQSIGSGLVATWKAVSGQTKNSTRYQSCEGEDIEPAELHYHVDGKSCSLDEPQYLPPPSIVHLDQASNAVMSNQLGHRTSYPSGCVSPTVSTVNPKQKKAGTTYMIDPQNTDQGYYNTDPNSPLVETPTRWKPSASAGLSFNNTPTPQKLSRAATTTSKPSNKLKRTPTVRKPSTSAGIVGREVESNLISSPQAILKKTITAGTFQTALGSPPRPIRQNTSTSNVRKLSAQQFAYNSSDEEEAMAETPTAVRTRLRSAPPKAADSRPATRDSDILTVISDYTNLAQASHTNLTEILTFYNDADEAGLVADDEYKSSGDSISSSSRSNSRSSSTRRPYKSDATSQVSAPSSLTSEERSSCMTEPSSATSDAETVVGDLVRSSTIILKDDPDGFLQESDGRQTKRGTVFYDSPDDDAFETNYMDIEETGTRMGERVLSMIPQVGKDGIEREKSISFSVTKRTPTNVTTPTRKAGIMGRSESVKNSPSTPLSRSKSTSTKKNKNMVWSRKNGKWERIDESEDTAVEEVDTEQEYEEIIKPTLLSFPTRTFSPPPLPLPPYSSNNIYNETITVPASLKIRSPPTPSIIRSTTAISASPTTTTTAKNSLLLNTTTTTTTTPTRILSDDLLFSKMSTSKTVDWIQTQSKTSSPSPSSSPQRKKAFLRSNHNQPSHFLRPNPSLISSCSSEESTTTSSTLATTKSQYQEIISFSNRSHPLSPLEKERQRQNAILRVQSIVHRGYANRSDGL